MNLENTTAKYTIQIVRDGAGIQEAATEFQQLDQVAGVVNGSLTRLRGSTAASQAALHEMHLSGRLVSQTFHEVNSVGMLLGMQMCPQLTMGAMAASSALHAMRGAAALTGAPLGLVGAALAGLTATVYAGISAWDLYKSKQQEVQTVDALATQQVDLKKRLLKDLMDLQEESRLDPGWGQYYQDLLNEAKGAGELSARIREVATAIRQLAPDRTQQKALDEIDKIINQLAVDTLAGFEKERAAARLTYEERKQQLLDLAGKAGMSPNAMIAQGREADTWYAAQLAQIQGRQTNEETQNRLKQFEEEITIQSLKSKNDRVAIAREEFAARVQFYHQLSETGAITEEQLVQLGNQALIKKLQAEARYTDQVKLHIMSIEEMEASAAEGFAGGMAHAFVEFASGTKSAGDAFKEFAVQFLEQVAEMILQMLILKAIQAAFFGGGGVSMAARGGFYPSLAADGLEGVSSISSPTYFPKFNVIAGETGREMLTVLARPRMMDVGGFQAVVGQAGKSTLAVTNAGALQRIAAGAGAGGAGGHLIIEVQCSPDAEARIISNSVTGAEVRITQRAQQNTPLRSAIKKAVA